MPGRLTAVAVLLASIGASVPTQGARAAPEVELGLGWSSSLGSRPEDIPGAPALSLRITLQAASWSLGGRALLLLGPEGQHVVGGGAPLADAAGFRAWGLLAEGGWQRTFFDRLQLALRLGAGIGRLVRIQQGQSVETYALEGDLGPLLAGSLALRWRPYSRWWLGIEGGLMLFTGVHQHNLSAEEYHWSVLPGGPVEPAGQVLLTLAFGGP